jgi:nicotinate-nucleotide--dimethylbenzimidazole phosphoribosyltransferase
MSTQTGHRSGASISNPGTVAPSAAESVTAAAGHIPPLDEGLRPAAQQKIDAKTKPLGALGTLESLAVQLALIQQRLNPRLDRKAVFVFAGDHGVAAEGVSAFPAEVTLQMVANFLAGGAAINVLCRHHDIDLHVVDIGVNADFEDHPALIRKKIRRGTRNFAQGPAMSSGEAVAAVEAGMAVIAEQSTRQRIDIVGLGEMGIANTTSAAAIISAVTGIDPADATGRGTGIDDAVLAHKTDVIARALALHRPDPSDGLALLQAVGGFEIAGIAGAALAAAAAGTAVVLDGVISTAGGLVAACLEPKVCGYLISGHRSVEPAQQAALDHLGLTPVVDYKMRLGEGTGAAMTIDVADAACRIMREMASFDEAGVSERSNSQ